MAKTTFFPVKLPTAYKGLNIIIVNGTSLPKLMLKQRRPQFMAGKGWVVEVLIEDAPGGPRLHKPQADPRPGA